MQFHIDLNTVLGSLTIAGIIGIFRLLWTMNGSMGRMKTWQEQHERQDDERHDMVMTMLNERRR